MARYPTPPDCLGCEAGLVRVHLFEKSQRVELPVGQAWEPPLRFVDIQEKGPYSLWEHTRLFVRRDLERIFDFRSAAVAELLSSSPA